MSKYIFLIIGTLLSLNISRIASAQEELFSDENADLSVSLIEHTDCQECLSGKKLLININNGGEIHELRFENVEYVIRAFTYNTKVVVQMKLPRSGQLIKIYNLEPLFMEEGELHAGGFLNSPDNRYLIYSPWSPRFTNPEINQNPMYIHDLMIPFDENMVSSKGKIIFPLIPAEAQSESSYRWLENTLIWDDSYYSFLAIIDNVSHFISIQYPSSNSDIRCDIPLLLTDFSEHFSPPIRYLPVDFIREDQGFLINFNDPGGRQLAIRLSPQIECRNFTF